jgi:hypothetical protein
MWHLPYGISQKVQINEGFTKCQSIFRVFHLKILSFRCLFLKKNAQDELKEVKILSS